MKQWQKIGTVNVDSGCLSLVDPGYHSSRPWGERLAAALAAGLGAKGMARVEGALWFRAPDGDGTYEVEMAKDEDGAILLRISEVAR